VADPGSAFGAHMEHEPAVLGACRQSSAWGLGAESAPKAERLFALSQPEKSANLSWNLF